MTNRKLRRGTWLAIVLLIASAMVVAIGVAAYLQQEAVEDQRAADKRAAAQRTAELAAYTECLNQWGEQLVQRINTRNATRAEYDTATQRRSDAIARVVRIVLELRATPPQATERQLDQALATAADADDDVAVAKARLDGSAYTYTTPTLKCGSTP